MLQEHTRVEQSYPHELSYCYLLSPMHQSTYEHTQADMTCLPEDLAHFWLCGRVAVAPVCSDDRFLHKRRVLEVADVEQRSV